ncbi:hypothetical protein OAJ44_02340 [Chloroflexi bacterium]|nr:hypothetical protein [Chloroflexota bacterium]
MELFLRSWKFVRYEITKNTTWYCVYVRTRSGQETLAEFTKGAESNEVGRIINDILETIDEKSIPSENDLEKYLGLNNSVESGSNTAAALSTVRTLISQLNALVHNLPLSAYMSGQFPSTIDLYANINRGLFATDRSPEEFGKAAYKAVAKGFKVIKCAPFDEIQHPNPKDIDFVAKKGIDRLLAVRQEVGSEVEILVDCHGRFEEASSRTVAELINPIGIGWFEEPLDPTGFPTELAELAKDISMPISGGEDGYGQNFFDALIRLNSVKTVMPDIKYCGGVEEAVRIANSAIDSKVGFSPHCPSGPVSLLASAHVCASINQRVILEHAVDESDYRHELINPAEIIKNGQLHMPTGPGLGATFDTGALEKYGECFSL